MSYLKIFITSSLAWLSEAWKRVGMGFSRKQLLLSACYLLMIMKMLLPNILTDFQVV